MFSLLIRRDGLIEPPQMGEFDSHCHILAGLDDGAPDRGTSLSIARVLVEMGIRTVVATPHVISDLYPNSSEKIRDAAEELRLALNREGLPLELLVGAEYYVERDLLDRIERDDLLAWGESRCVLFESPVETEPMLLEEVVFNLKAAGYCPVLAHVERYRWVQDAPERLDDLKRLGARFQVNHPSFHLPKTSRRGEMARRLFVRGLVDYYGTDMHRASFSDGRETKSADKGFFSRFISR